MSGNDKDKAALEYAERYQPNLFDVDIAFASFRDGESHGRQSLARKLVEWMKENEKAPWGVGSFFVAWEELRKKLEGE